MPGVVPEHPKIYHIVHVDRLASILDEGYLLSDSEVESRQLGGTTIGDANVKLWRRKKLLTTFPDLRVGDCVPFYFCPRSVLLYLNWKAGQGKSTGSSIPENRGGEDEVVHLVADFRTVVKHADANCVPWLFTDVNASVAVANEYTDISQLSELDWDTINTTHWPGKREYKMAEFLVKNRFPMRLVEGIGVKLQSVQHRVEEMLQQHGLSTPVAVMKNWYYGT